MEKLLTVIVPTYNMEMYLDKCLTSLIVGEPECEMMQSLEVLVINDGSTDKSSEIAHGYEKCFPDTFRVVDKENGNYGSCINVALPLATGKYVKILDADDWFDTEVFKEYLTWLQDKDVDAVFTDFYKVQKETKTLTCLLDVTPYEIINFKDCQNKMCSLWMHNVTYNLGIFKGLGYHQSEGVPYTDNEWMFLPMSVVKKFIYYPKALYCYLLGRSGQTVDPDVLKQNYAMYVEMVLARIQMYHFYCNDHEICNMISVNKNFLYQSCLSKTTEMYMYLLLNLNEDSLAKLLKNVDQRILGKFPYFYTKLNSVKYPNWKVYHLHLNFKIIHSYRKFGVAVVKIQLWFANHFLGLYSRLNKLRGT